MFPGQCGNTAFFFKSQPDQFHFEFRGIVFPGKSFFSAHEVSTCKISGCLSYRILDSGPDGTQTTLTLNMDVQKVDSARALVAGVMHWAVTTGGFNSETAQDVMPRAVERRFGNELPASPVEWLTDNGSCYRANETRLSARMLGLESKNTAVRSPESNKIAESFVKTIKRDYIVFMPKPDVNDGIA